MIANREGLISEKQTGLPLSRAGSVEFIETLTRKVASREGFGDILAQGILKSAESLGERAKELTSKHIVTWANEIKDYDPMVISTAALLYATEPRKPLLQLDLIADFLNMWIDWAREMPGAFFSTEELYKVAATFWGSTVAADFSTYDGKALAAKLVQDRIYALESLILCGSHWPITMNTRIGSIDIVDDQTLESQVFSAITGKDVDGPGLHQIGERIFNLQRAILLREGWRGRKGDRILDYFHQEPLPKNHIFFNPDALVPGRNGKILSKIGAIVDHDEFEKMKSEYYQLRGWDVETGFPTKTKLIELGLGDISSSLKKGSLLG